MRKDTKINLQGFIIYMLITTSGVLGLLLAGQYTEVLPAYSEPEIKILSVRELQTFLNEQHDPWNRYKCKVDGKIGPETIQAWDNYVCDQKYKESTYERD